MLVSTVLDLTVAAHQEAGVVERAFLVARLGLKAHGMHTHILLGGSKHQRVQKVIQRRIRFEMQSRHNFLKRTRPGFSLIPRRVQGQAQKVCRH